MIRVRTAPAMGAVVSAALICAVGCSATHSSPRPASTPPLTQPSVTTPPGNAPTARLTRAQARAASITSVELGGRWSSVARAATPLGSHTGFCGQHFPPAASPVYVADRDASGGAVVEEVLREYRDTAMAQTFVSLVDKAGTGCGSFSTNHVLLTLQPLQTPPLGDFSWSVMMASRAARTAIVFVEVGPVVVELGETARRPQTRSLTRIAGVAVHRLRTALAAAASQISP